MGIHTTPLLGLAPGWLTTDRAAAITVPAIHVSVQTDRMMTTSAEEAKEYDVLSRAFVNITSELMSRYFELLDESEGSIAEAIEEFANSVRENRREGHFFCSRETLRRFNVHCAPCKRTTNGTRRGWRRIGQSFH